MIMTMFQFTDTHTNLHVRPKHECNLTTVLTVVDFLMDRSDDITRFDWNHFSDRFNMNHQCMQIGSVRAFVFFFRLLFVTFESFTKCILRYGAMKMSKIISCKIIREQVNRVIE